MAKELLKPATITNAKPGNKDKRLNDGNGLYLLVKPETSVYSQVRHDNGIDTQTSFKLLTCPNQTQRLPRSIQNFLQQERSYGLGQAIQ